MDIQIILKRALRQLSVHFPEVPFLRFVIVFALTTAYPYDKNIKHFSLEVFTHILQDPLQSNYRNELYPWKFKNFSHMFWTFNVLVPSVTNEGLSTRRVLLA